MYADGGLPVDGRSVFGTGFCFDTGAADARCHRRCSAAARLFGRARVATDRGHGGGRAWSQEDNRYIYLWSVNVCGTARGGGVDKCRRPPPEPAFPTGRLDPKLHGVAIGFEPLDGERARHGEIDWVGRAFLCIPPGVLDPPLGAADVHDRSTVDSLDLVILHIRGVDPRLRTIQSFPLGDASLLNYTSEQVLVLGFGMPKGGVLAPAEMGGCSATSSAMPAVRTSRHKVGDIHGGHSGGPVLNSRGEVVGWVMRKLEAGGTDGIDEFRPVETPDTKYYDKPMQSFWGALARSNVVGSPDVARRIGAGHLSRCVAAAAHHLQAA